MPDLRQAGEVSGQRKSYPPVLISEAEIRGRVRALGEQITRDYAALTNDEGQLVVIGVLTGAFMFVADLVREIGVPVVVDFIRASSYGASRMSAGAVELAPGSWSDVEGRDVLVVEDVLDTGRTLKTVIAALKAHHARSLRTVALLRKPGADMKLDYVGFDIDARFVIGYGLDDAGKWRSLPYVGYVDGAPS